MFQNRVKNPLFFTTFIYVESSGIRGKPLKSLKYSVYVTPTVKTAICK